MQQQLAESEARIADWRHRLQAAVGINGQLIVDVLPQVALISARKRPSLRCRQPKRQTGSAWCSGNSSSTCSTHPDTRYLLLIGADRSASAGVQSQDDPPQ
jgi:hypothetical protein